MEKQAQQQAQNRDVRTLLFSRFNQPRKDTQEIGTIQKWLVDLGNEDQQNFFAMGSFDALAVYPTLHESDKAEEWMKCVYEDKQRIIAGNTSKMVNHSMHLVSKHAYEQFWKKGTKPEYPFFIATFLYGVKSSENRDPMNLLDQDIESKCCSAYEKHILKYLHNKVPAENAARSNISDNVAFMYAVYNGVSISDVAVLWYVKAEGIGKVLQLIQSIQSDFVARKTLSTICIPVDNGTGNIADVTYSQIENIDVPESIAVSIHGSIRDNNRFEERKIALGNLLGVNKRFINFGTNDFVVHAEIAWSKFAGLLREYQHNSTKLSEACWEIHTEIQLADHIEMTTDRESEDQEDRLDAGQRNAIDPTELMYRVYTDYKGIFQEILIKEGISEFPWAYAMLEMLGTHLSIDRHPMLHGPSYLIWRSMKIANSYIAGEVEGYEYVEDDDNKIKNWKKMLKRSETLIFRFIRNLDQVTEQICRNDDVLLSGRTNAHTIHISLPESALDFYHAFLRMIVDFLIKIDGDNGYDNASKIEYDFLLSPQLRERMRIDSVFKTENKDAGSGEKIWPEKQLYLLEFPLDCVFDPIDFFVPVIHECFHCFGDHLRDRFVRKQYMALFIAANIMAALGLEGTTNSGLFAQMARYICNGNFETKADSSIPYLSEIRRELETNAYEILGYDGLKRLFDKTESKDYSLFRRSMLDRWDLAKATFSHSNSSEPKTIVVKTVIDACFYYFRECYADAMTIELLKLEADEYLDRFIKEIKLFDVANYGGKRGATTQSGKAALAQRIAIVLSVCYEGFELDGWAKKLGKEESAGKDENQESFAVMLKRYYSVLTDGAKQMTDGNELRSYDHPAFALWYVKDYLTNTILEFREKCGFKDPPSGELGKKVKELKEECMLIRTRFDGIIRGGDMFGKEFYNIIYAQHRAIKKSL